MGRKPKTEIQFEYYKETIPCDVTEVFLLLMEHGGDRMVVIEKLKEKYGQVIKSHVVAALFDRPRFKEKFREFLEDAAVKGEMFGLYKENKGMAAFMKSCDVMDRFIDSVDPGQAELGLKAASTIMDRTALTQKTSRTEGLQQQSIVISEEAMRVMMEAKRESDQYRNQKTIDVTPANQNTASQACEQGGYIDSTNTPIR